VTRDAAKRFGFDPAFRLTTEGNFFLGGLNLNVDCATVADRYGAEPGSADAWKFAFLWYAIGAGAADYFWNQAGRPSSYQGMLDFAASGSVSGYGRVSADKERLRLGSPERYWQDGVASGLPMTPGLPFLTPAPGGIGYGYVANLPSNVQGLIRAGRLAPHGIGDVDAPTATGLIAIGVLAAAVAKLV
jgi:hypothetical protein